MQETDFRVDFQVHLHRDNYGIENVLQTMEKKEIDAIAVLSHPHENYISKWFLRPTMSYDIQEGSRVIKARKKYEDGKDFYLFLGQEIESSDGWHFLDIGRIKGYNSEDKKPLEAYIEEGLADNRILIFDHSYADVERRFADIRPEKERKLIKIAEKYGSQIAFEWNAYCLPLVRALIPGYTDVNKKIDRLAKTFNLRIIPTSDSHVRNSRLLNGIGTSFVEFPVLGIDTTNESSLYQSVKSKVHLGNYDQNKRYVSFPHFFEAFGWPMVKGKLGIK